eukprot:m51a1_g10759 hypothetical protein (447) ;mRNA; r:5263-7506
MPDGGRAPARSLRHLRMGKALVAAVLAVAALAVCADALVVRGHKKTTAESTYIGRFTFSNSHGDQGRDGIFAHYTPKTFGKNTFWVVYYDTNWYPVYHNSSASCMDKVTRASKSYQFVSTPDNEMQNWTLKVVDRVRPHIWFVAILNCPVEGKRHEYEVGYTVEFRNIDGSQVGYDQVGLKALYACFFVFFFLLTVAHAFGDYFLYLRNSFHHIVKLLLATLVLMTFATMFSMIHWAKYEGDGVGCTGCETFGGLLDNAAYIVFTVLLIAIASGWAITNQTLTRKWWVVGLFAANATILIILYIIAAAGSGEDTAANIATAYEYTQAFGVATIFFGVIYFIIWAVTIGYFGLAVWTSYRDETQYDKRVFYLIFGACYLAWFIIVPFFSLISIALDAWIRQRMMSAIHEVISLIGMGVLVVLLWPTFVYKYFRIISPDLLSDNPSGL